VLLFRTSQSAWSIAPASRSFAEGRHNVELRVNALQLATYDSRFTEEIWTENCRPRGKVKGKRMKDRGWRTALLEGRGAKPGSGYRLTPYGLRITKDKKKMMAKSSYVTSICTRPGYLCVIHLENAYYLYW